MYDIDNRESRIAKMFNKIKEKIREFKDKGISDTDLYDLVVDDCFAVKQFRRYGILNFETENESRDLIKKVKKTVTNEIIDYEPKNSNNTNKQPKSCSTQTFKFLND